MAQPYFWSLGLLLAVGTSLFPDDQPALPPYRASADEVRLSFSVVDQDDQGVATLAVSDFAVVDQGIVVRSFQSFERSDWKKFHVAVVVDGSESVARRFRKDAVDLLRLAVVDHMEETTGVPDENVSLFSFRGAEPVLICASNCRASHASDTLADARSSEVTPLFDTILAAAEYLGAHGDDGKSEARNDAKDDPKPDVPFQKVLILFSDGQDTVSRNSLRDALDAALAENIQIDCINMGRATSTRGAAVLRAIAYGTGGRYFPPQEDASGALKVLLEEFRASYTVTYRVPNAAHGFHTVRILPTHNQNLQFRSRSGYYYPNQTP